MNLSKSALAVEVVEHAVRRRAGELDAMLRELETGRCIDHRDLAVGPLADEHAELGLCTGRCVDVERGHRDEIWLALRILRELIHLRVDRNHLRFEIADRLDLVRVKHGLHPARLGGLCSAVECLAGDDVDALLLGRQRRGADHVARSPRR
ncbi:MAG: hypothetical protein E6J90_00310 [Deltaproteobacteria bacterium]|nr:MAG: hypothetical protein E6J90_00310 [Deltaproteobacteria bacterium]